MNPSPSQPDPQSSAPTRPVDPAPKDGLRLPEQAAASTGSQRSTEYDGAEQIGADLVEQGLRQSIEDEERPVERVEVTSQRPRNATKSC